MSHSLWTERDTNLVLVMPRISRLSQYQDTSNNNVQWVPARIVAIDPVRDLAVLEIDGQIEIRRGGVEGSDQVEPGARIATLGFPHSSDAGRFVLTQQDTTVGVRVLISSNGVASKHLVLNVQTRPGQSGSPVISYETGSIVAVVVGSFAPSGAGGISLGGIDPQTLHQTTHAISAEYLIGMIDG